MSSLPAQCGSGENKSFDEQLRVIIGSVHKLLDHLIMKLLKIEIVNLIYQQYTPYFLSKQLVNVFIHT